MQLESNLPILPLRDFVVFPGVVVPLFVGRPKSLSALDAALNSDDQLLALFPQLDSNAKEPEFTDLCHVGVVAKVEQTVTLPDGTRKTLFAGLRRILLKTQLASCPFLQCQAEAVKENGSQEVTQQVADRVSLRLPQRRRSRRSQNTQGQSLTNGSAEKPFHDFMLFSDLRGERMR